MLNLSLHFIFTYKVQWTVDILSEIAHGSLDILMLINLLFISTSEVFSNNGRNQN